MENTFQLENLLPNFDLLLAWQIDTAEGISAGIVFILAALFTIFLIISVIKFFQSKKHVKFYFNLLKGLDRSELAAQRSEIKEKADTETHNGRLWREFDESLVYSADKKQLSNTLDAAHFFNTRSLARGLTENRLLAAVPGFLTALGVIGTFVGLQLGLSGLNTDGSVEELKGGIGIMISGASIAFLTSVWGILLSVIFNFVEKLMERKVRESISTLQNHIDFLYPRINAEQSLVEIADYSQSSAEIMQGLAEKIGIRMQEALVEVSATISSGLKDSLHEIMAPALEKMAMDAQTGSEKALESMLERFMDGFGSAGEQQREMMVSASGEVQKAVGELGGQMSNFLNRLDERSRDVDEKNKLQKEQLENMVDGLESKSLENQQAMSRQFEGMLGNITAGVNSQMEEQAQRDQERMESFKVELGQVTSQQRSMVEGLSQAVNEQLTEQRALDKARSESARQEMENVQTSQEHLCARIKEMVSFQEKTTEQLYSQLTNVSKSFTEIANTNSVIAQDIRSASDKMQTSGVQLSLLGSKLNETTVELGSMVSQAAKTTDSLSKRNVAAVEQLDIVLEQYKVFAAEITETSGRLDSATQHAELGFQAVDRHLQSFQESMESQVIDLGNQMSSLMTDFASRVQNQTSERLNVWNSETSEYIGTMTNAVNAIADVVEEIEEKVGSAA